jgi:hypothetical protein
VRKSRDNAGQLHRVRAYPQGFGGVPDRLVALGGRLERRSLDGVEGVLFFIIGLSTAITAKRCNAVRFTETP